MQHSKTPQSEGGAKLTSGHPNSRKCFKCHGFGHIASDCPYRRAIILIEEAIDEEEVSDEDQADEEDVFYADQGDLLVCQNLNTQQGDKYLQWLHYNIFHTRCISHGKVSDVVIDSGSFKNVVSTHKVDKLKLKKGSSIALQAYLAQQEERDHVSKCCLV